MANLLPIENKRLIKRELLRRFIVFFGLGLVVLLFVQLIFSYILFFLINLTVENIEDEKLNIERLTKMKNSNVLGSQAERLNNLLLNFQEADKQMVSVSIIFSKILEILPSSVKIDSFVFEIDQCQISGFASTRNGLIKFIDNLNTSDFFEGVESPVSNLLDEKNIDFLLTLKLNAN